MGDRDAVPTVLEWGGGPEAFRRWLDVFYDLIEQEPEIAPLFGGVVSEQHRAHAAAWWVEVMGGPADYTEHTAAMSACSPTTADWRSRPSSGCGS